MKVQIALPAAQETEEAAGTQIRSAIHEAE